MGRDQPVPKRHECVCVYTVPELPYMYNKHSHYAYISDNIVILPLWPLMCVCGPNGVPCSAGTMFLAS